MSGEITIYGSSDDLIEIEGDIDEEFTYPDKPTRLGFSDGTVLSIVYDQRGTWRIAPVVAGSAKLNIVVAPVDDTDNYSDRATLQGDISWVLCGTSYARRR